MSADNVTGVSHQMMTQAEVAEVFGVASATVARWARQGLLRASKTPGGIRRYLRDDVEAFARQHPPWPGFTSLDDRG